MNAHSAQDKTRLARALGERARAASRSLGAAPTAQKDRALESLARRLREGHRPILEANAADLDQGKAQGLSEALLDRLMLDEKRLEAVADAVLQVRALPDPIGEVTSTWRRPNGLTVQKVRIPLGVILMIYEARPNVTVDAAALCLKSGNAVILRGGKEALQTNLALHRVVAAALGDAGLAPEGAQLVQTPDREVMLALLQLDELIDLAIPRGGEGLIRFVAQNARVPVIKHYKGVCHVYVHAAADPRKALEITVNAKAQRPGVCNAAECLLIDRAAIGTLPAIARGLIERKVELRCDPAALAALQQEGLPAVPASPEDWGREFLDRILAVRVVEGLDEAMEHIARYGSLHTEAIVTQDLSAAARFTREVVASAVMVNASTRFNDGGELGLGAEIGISTSKLHAFGPMGLAELTAQRFVVVGDGQVRG
ncbi:MAG: glutamate-5-semialdehyde dehydrogenase [Deltaproteobacteria bacterium]|nr:glutamate-5-semialdehyde dehydrogenase [Deltaproteobacteria bacterium]